MLTGFNTNIKYKGEVFHIQTEDSGLRNPVITTLLYRGGVILASKKTNYRALIPEDTISISSLLREKIKQLMTDQHRSMISDLLSGRFDEVITGEKPPFQEMRSMSHESLRKEQTMGSQNSGVWHTGSGKEEMGINLSDGKSKEQDTTINPGPEKEPPAKSQTMRSLDDILLDHIMKKKKNI